MPLLNDWDEMVFKTAILNSVNMTKNVTCLKMRIIYNAVAFFT